jgi:serine protease Do
MLSSCHRFACLCLAAVFLSSLSARAESTELTLKNGCKISGELLREREDAVLLDLGYTVLSVPRGEVMSLEKKAASVASPAVTVLHEDVYSIEPQRVALPVEKNVDRVSEAVVQIQTSSGLGSGFLINDQGYVITNQHVIAGEREITVVVYRRQASGGLEKQPFPKVKILAMNGFLDLALLQIDDPAVVKELHHVPLGDSDSLTQGQSVFAIGSPLGLERTVSQGIVSVKARETSGAWCIQSTTQINPGNSGGPLFNSRGEVVGVNNMKLAAVGVEGLGFSIPASLVKLFIKNRDAFAFDPRHPNAGYRYLPPPAPEAVSTAIQNPKS